MYSPLDDWIRLKYYLEVKPERMSEIVKEIFQIPDCMVLCFVIQLFILSYDIDYFQKDKTYAFYFFQILSLKKSLLLV